MSSRFLPVLIVAGAATLAGACASTGARPRPFPVPAGSSAPPAASPPGARPEPAAPSGTFARGRVDTYALTSTALALRGAPYRNGGSDPSGFDCSGFTQYVFGQHGIALPRDVKDQFQVGKPVKPNDLEPGDLVFFETVTPGASHVAIMIGGDEFIHAPSSRGVVRVEHLRGTYWAHRFVGARRVD